MITGAPRKSLGQHFLHDRNIIEKIIAAIQPRSDDHFVEIGPGRGAMTLPLLPLVAQLDAIEIDRRLASALTGRPALTVHTANALKFDFTAVSSLPSSLRLIGNLPYNISTPLLFHILEQACLFQDIHVMLQKEVVQRMTAGPGSRTYGRLSVAIQARCRTSELFTIKPGSFLPPPKVDSAFVRLIPDASIMADVKSEQDFNRIVAAAFSMRRKKLSNCLKGALTPEEIRATGTDPGARAEMLDVDSFIRLANRFHVTGRGNPA